jgi:O-antigen ligase
MTGPYENPIDLATYLMVVIPMLLMGALAAHGRRRAAWWSLVALLAAALLRTEAVGAWLGFASGLALLCLRHRAARRYGLVLLVLGGLGVGLFAREEVREALSWTELSKQDRVVMWQAAAKMIQDRPWFGQGLNTFMANYLAYWVGGERQPRYAHNCYLQVAAETGLVGLLAFAALLGAMVARLAARPPPASGPDGGVLIGYAAGLIAFLVQAAIDTNFYSLRHAVLFWVLAGVAIGWREHLDDPPALRAGTAA